MSQASRLSSWTSAKLKNQFDNFSNVQNGILAAALFKQTMFINVDLELNSLITFIMFACYFVSFFRAWFVEYSIGSDQ